MRHQVADLESELVEKAKTITRLEDQPQYQLKAVQDLVKSLGPPLPVSGIFSSIPSCVRASHSIFKEALARADQAEKRVSQLEEQCKGYQLRLSGMEKDFQVSQNQVNEFILRSKSLELELDGSREELAAARTALERAHKDHKEQVLTVASFYLERRCRQSQGNDVECLFYSIP